jgi:UDP-glucose-4-epimerase GalE
MNILVTGGAGYIGAHCCKTLASRGHHPVVFDSLITGHRQHVQWGDFFRGDTNSAPELDACLSRHKIDAAMHFAAFIEVGESVADPQKYYANNVAGTLQLLQALVRHGIRHFVFSSSAAIYGNPLQVPIDEEHSARPLNPYGWSKLMVEIMLADFQSAYDLNWIALRYFNAAGADEAADIGEWHDPESHLIPRLLDAALDRRQPVRVYGTDYPTPDGTCIRDYIHVNDLAGAHVQALEHLAAGGSSGVFNLGQGRGYSVMEVIGKVQEITGRPLVVQKAARRPGDAAVLIASNQKALQQLGWSPRHSDLDNIIASAWKWHRNMRGAV